MRSRVPAALLAVLSLALGETRPGACQAAAAVREEVLAPDARFLPDGRPAPWSQERRGAGQVLRGAGWEGEYTQISGLTASPDGKRFAGFGKRGAWFMIIDGKETGPYEDLAAPTFSPDGQRVAYYAKQGGRWRVVVDGKEEPEFSGQPDNGEWGFEGMIQFSPDSRRLAYVSYADIGKGHLVVDGSPWPEGLHCSSPQFSPDGRHVAATCWPGFRTGPAVLLDGREVGRYDAVTVAFHPKTSELAVLWRSGDRFGSFGLGLTALADPARRFTRVVTSSGSYGAAIHSLRFSADGAHFAYAVTDDTQVDLYVDGRSVFYRSGTSLGLRSLLLSADARRLAAMVTAAGKGKTRVVDIDLGPDPETASWVPLRVREYAVVKENELYMSPAGRHLAYIATDMHLRSVDYWVVLDGQEGPRYQMIDQMTFPVWDGEDGLSYFAQRVVPPTPKGVATRYRVTQSAPASPAWVASP